MFTEKQLKILDQIDPYIDNEEGESRKGYVQIYPVIHVTEEVQYWCDKTAQFKVPGDDLIGDWIADELVSETYYDSWDKVRDFNWKRATYKQIVLTKWAIAEE